MALERLLEAIQQLIHDGTLVAGHQIQDGLRHFLRIFQRLQVVSLHITEGRRLDPTEAEIKGITAGLGDGKSDRFGIPFRSQLIDNGPSRISQAQMLGQFVEGFPGGIVAGSRNFLVVSGFLQIKKTGMTSRYHQRKGGKLGLGMIQKNRRDVPFQMVDSDKGNLQSVG